MGGFMRGFGDFMGMNEDANNINPRYGNPALQGLQDQNSIYGTKGAQDAMTAYGTGNGTIADAMGAAGSMQLDDPYNPGSTMGLNPSQIQGFKNALATDPLTGSKFATEQVQNNPLLMQGLNDIQGQLKTGQGLQSDQTGRLKTLQDQGFQLTPEDQTLYGQTSGNIARQFGQQGNQMSQDLASRGLSSAPSGAAGSMFSGLAGNQNEMLAKAQQDIMQQRFTNTQNQITQQQKFIGDLNSQNNSAAGNYSSQAANDVNQQYGRQLQGVQDQDARTTRAAQLQQSANTDFNSSQLASGQYNMDNRPKNFSDYLNAGLGSSTYNVAGAPGKAASGAAGSAGSGAGLFAGAA